MDIRIETSPRGGFRLEAAQFLPQPRDRVFHVFSDAFQLEKLTPLWLEFSVVTPSPIKIEAGTLIDYRVKLHGIPVRWRSLISEWEPPLRFVDRQMRGPYRRWHHEHIFESVEGGTLCHDIVDYDVIGGRLVHALFVRPDLLKIFAFRHDQLSNMFPSSGE
jgi:ligand-binding SRPBCC domain-containing protein